MHIDSDVTQSGSPGTFPPFSMILCSRNRQEQVRSCLEKLDPEELSARSVELILVNSASTDETQLVFQQFAKAHPEVDIKVVNLPVKGLGIARNAGVAESSADTLIFLDDDVYLTDDYFSVLQQLVDSSPDTLGLFSGKIEKFDPSDSNYGCKLKPKVRMFRAGSVVIPGAFHGTNLACRRPAFDAVQGFDDNLGPGKEFRCDDIDFVARVLKAGYGGIYRPDLRVLHHHGRKDGDDIDALSIANNKAAGAYFAKMFKLGYWSYLPIFLLYVASAPVRPYMRVFDFFRGFFGYLKRN